MIVYIYASQLLVATPPLELCNIDMLLSFTSLQHTTTMASPSTEDDHHHVSSSVMSEYRELTFDSFMQLPWMFAY